MCPHLMARAPIQAKGNRWRELNPRTYGADASAAPTVFRSRTGRLLSAIEFAFVLSRGKPISTIGLVQACYPFEHIFGELKSWHRSNVARAADRTRLSSRNFRKGTQPSDSGLPELWNAPARNSRSAYSEGFDTRPRRQCAGGRGTAISRHSRADEPRSGNAVWLTAANRVDSSRPSALHAILSRKNVHQIEASRARDKYNYHVRHGQQHDGAIPRQRIGRHHFATTKTKRQCRFGTIAAPAGLDPPKPVRQS